MNKIIVALDGMTAKRALELAGELSSLVWGFKVNDLLLECGAGIVTELKAYGNVFADPKLYDIPNTVANGVSRLADAGADLITIHASGGSKMIEAAVAASGASNILAITVLTSFQSEEVAGIYGREANEQVLLLARIAADSGAYGIVCSPKELSMLSAKQELSNLVKVTPGVRPSWYTKADDQSRVAAPENALADGADLVVIGRPITGDPSPKSAVEKIVQNLS